MAVREILIVDDDAQYRTFTAQVLANRGFVVREAQNGVEGLQQVELQLPDMIFVDFVMPRMNGYHFLKALEAKGLMTDKPVVLMSTLTDKVGDRLLETTLASECLKKPFSEEQLIAVVERHIADESLARTSTTSMSAELEVEPDWLLVSSLREKLHNLVADVIAEKVPALVQATTAAQVLVLVGDVLDGVAGEETVADIVRMVREHDHPDHQ